MIVLLIALLVFGAIGWMGREFYLWRQTQQPFDYGTPTPLADEAPMETAVCRIRKELAALQETACCQACVPRCLDGAQVRCREIYMGTFS
ncbi:MAG: hypothetical protein WBQ78_08180 [Gammaproteobacteria bacterium]